MPDGGGNALSGLQMRFARVETGHHHAAAGALMTLNSHSIHRRGHAVGSGGPFMMATCW